MTMRDPVCKETCSNPVLSPVEGRAAHAKACFDGLRTGLEFFELAVRRQK